MTTLLIAIALLTTEKPPLYVFVHTKLDASGFVDAEQKRRMESVGDVIDVIDKDTKHFQPVIVARAEEADVIVEIVSSSKEDTGERTGVGMAVGFGVSVGSSKATKRPVVRALVSVRDYTTEITTNKKVGSWTMAARHWQVEFRKWVDLNAERLAARAPSESR
jgi:hypothetical protein